MSLKMWIIPYTFNTHDKNKQFYVYVYNINKLYFTLL